VPGIAHAVIQIRLESQLRYPINLPAAQQRSDVGTLCHVVWVICKPTRLTADPANDR